MWKGKNKSKIFSEAFRCGLFFADPTDDSIPTVKLPVAPLFVLNNSWPAPECQSGQSLAKILVHASDWSVATDLVFLE